MVSFSSILKLKSIYLRFKYKAVSKQYQGAEEYIFYYWICVFISFIYFICLTYSFSLFSVINYVFVSLGNIVIMEDNWELLRT